MEKLAYLSLENFRELAGDSEKHIIWGNNVDRKLILGTGTVSSAVFHQCPHCGSPINAIPEESCPHCGTFLSFLSIEKGRELVETLSAAQQENAMLRNTPVVAKPRSVY